jgi:hypothetical protein
MSKRLILGAVAVFVIAGVVVVAGFAQNGARGKGYTLRGTVEEIYDSDPSIRINQERIEGYSDARIATYHVDDAAILKKLHVDDKIVATVYENEDTLFDIRIVRIDDRLIPFQVVR